MATKMELSLDDIIKTTPGIKRRGGGRGGTRGGAAGRGGGGRGRGAGGLRRSFGAGGGGARGGRMGGGRFSGGGARLGRSSGAADGVWVHDKFEGGRGSRVGIVTGGGGGGGSKITVSNLHFGVSDADIIELFGEIGPIRYASVHYDRSGRSMGKADVVFERRADAQLAINQYNGVPLDGRSMQITYANAAPVTVVQTTSPRTLRQVQGGRVGVRRSGSPPKRGGAAIRRGGRGGGGPGRGRGGLRGQKTPTAAELDAELDAYVSANAK